MGASARQVDTWVRSGRIELLAPAVFGFLGHAPTWGQRLWVAHLHAGPSSVVSHESAARLHGFPQAPAGRVVLSVARRHSLEDVEWHRVHDVSPDDVVHISGLPVTSAARTAFDVAGVFGAVRLQHLLEHGVTERKFTLAEVGVVRARLRRQGKRGVVRLETCLDALDGRPVSRSELEDRLDDVIARAGLPAPEHEFPLPSPAGTVGFVDRCWAALRWIVEADGRRWHARRLQMAVDADRTNGAAALGYLTTRLMWEHLVHDPHGTALLLRAIYEERLRSVGRLS
ncbi:MAG: hypothetical protein ACKO04_12320 [Actinomycetes bacterium]